MNFKSLLKTCAYAIQGYALAHCTLDYVGDFVMCEGPSMEPTLFTNDKLLVEKISVQRHSIQLNRGDIVIFRSLHWPRRLACKRVVGLPGDVIQTPRLEIPYVADETVVIKDRSTNRTVNAAEEQQENLVDKLRYKRVVVPKGHIWVQGDNPSQSNDSRHYGPVPQGLIRGRVFARFYPFSEMKLL